MKKNPLIPRCPVHLRPMQRIKNQPVRRGNWSARFRKDDFKRYACPIAGCPYVVAIEKSKPTPVPQPPKVKQRRVSCGRSVNWWDWF